jgi:hypothetical protein
VAGRGLAKLIAEAVEGAFGGPATPSATTKWLTPADPGYVFQGADNQGWWAPNQIRPRRPGGPVGTIHDPNQLGLPGIGDQDSLLAALVSQTVRLPDQSVRDITAFLDSQQGHLVTPELYSTARIRDPDALRRELEVRMPPDIVRNRNPLGMDARVFHYTDAGRGNLPGDPPFEVFEPRRGGFNQMFDSLGPHVGTFNAADERRYTKNSPIQTYLDSAPAGYAPDLHPDAAPYAAVPGKGSLLELSANLSRPFRYEDANLLADELGVPGIGGWSKGEDAWNEDDINSVLQTLLYDDTPYLPGLKGNIARMAGLRRDLAARGFTHVPYTNNVEDAGSTSHVMLTDRPEGSAAVLRDREALFHPALRHLPNLTAGLGAAGLPLGALLAGETPRKPGS